MCEEYGAGELVVLMGVIRKGIGLSAVLIEIVSDDERITVNGGQSCQPKGNGKELKMG